MSTFKTPKGTELPLLNLRGKAYLQVAHRLVWFREINPLWGIETKMKECQDDYSIAYAEIKDDKGRIVATAHKREDTKGFADHMEKAETGAIGRALALCGFGTQFADELDETPRIVDSPVLIASSVPKSSNLGTLIKPVVVAKQLEPGKPFVISFGRYKGVDIRSIPKPELINYCQFIRGNADKDNKPLTGAVRDFMDAADDLLGEKLPF